MILASATISRAKSDMRGGRSLIFAPRSGSVGTWLRWTRRCAQSQRRRRLVDAALNKGEHRSWDFQPLRDASKQYMRNNMDLDDLEAMARFPSIGRPPN